MTTLDTSDTLGTLDTSGTPTFEPLIITYCCYWCSYTAADLAGTSRTQYPPNTRMIRVQCSGMVHPNLVIDALTNGADGVLMCGCHEGDCHYREGNLRAKARADAIAMMLEDFNLEPERYRLEWVSASEGPRFAQVVTEMVEKVRKVGPSPYK
ncbi:MAG: hydrogenase iron-sulfur subunit [Chloroflexi bacterium]|nr:hydrogenase iron-sulfur subunit [Chloroflexota bacterium]